MDRLEDDLRATLHTPNAAVDADAFLQRVHAGARRRRRRRYVVAAAVAAIVAAGGTGLLTLPGEPNGPSQYVASPSPSGAVSPARPKAISISAVSPDRWWVLSSAPCASSPTHLCARVTQSGGQPEMLPRIPVPAEPSSPTGSTVDGVRFAVDGQNGWLFGGALWATHDGGASWHRVSLPRGTVVDSLAAYGATVYAVTESATGVTVLATPASADRWAALPAPRHLQPPTTPLMLARGVRAFAALDPGAGGYAVVASHDGGRTWSTQPSPCGAVDSTAATGTSLWLTCQADGAGAVFTSPDGVTWSRVGGVLLGEGARLAPRTDRSTMIYRGDRAALLDPGGSRAVHVPLGRGEGIWYAGFNDPDHGFVVTTRGRVLRSADGGLTWDALS